jgi:putative transposase
MPRPPRFILPGVAVHIIQRGNDRMACFRHDNDYLMYLAHLRQLAEKYECRLHAYCLMTNHVHLLLTPGESGSCTWLMRDLGQRYVQYFNRRHERTGTLWEGRFRSCLVESAPYVLACYRYIESNPVRAKMVDHPVGYLWSSYAINSGMRTDPLIAPHPEYAALGIDIERRRAAYRSLFDRELDPALLRAVRDATNSDYPLASDAFKAAAISPLGRRTERQKAGRKAKARDAAFALE